MNCIRIIPDGRKLEIVPQAIELVKLQASYAAMGNSSNDYTFPVRLANTAGNQKIIQQLRDCKDWEVEWELLSNGVQKLRGSKLKFIEQEEDTISVQLIGNYYLWRLMFQDKSFCDLFDLGTYQLTSQLIIDSQKRNGDSGELFVYPSIVWGSELMHKPAYFWKELLVRSFKSVGYQLTYDGQIANLPAFRDLITPHFAGVVKTKPSTCISPVIHGYIGIHPPLSKDEVDITVSNPGEVPCALNEVDTEEVIEDGCIVAYASTVRDFQTVTALLDAEPFFFDSPIAANDPEGLFQSRTITTQVNGETNIFEGIVFVPNTRGKYKLKLKFQFYKRVEVGVTVLYRYFHTKEIVREADAFCDKPIVMYYAYDLPLTQKFIRVSLCGESEDIFNATGFDDTVGGHIKVLATMTVLRIDEPHHVCAGSQVDLNLNCPSLQPLQLVSFLEESLGFMFLDKGQGNVSMIHRLDHFGIQHELNAEDWRNIVDCRGAKDTLIRSKYKELLKFTYKNEDKIHLVQYEEIHGKALGEGRYEISDKNSTLSGEQTMNPSNVFSATAMIQMDNGLWLPQIGEEVFEETTPRVLIYEGQRTIVDFENLEDTVKYYGLSYFYKENAPDAVVQLDFSNTHGLGLLSRLWWRYLQIIACGVEVEAQVLIDDLSYQELQLSAAKYFKSRDIQGVMQMYYHFLNEVAYKTGGETPTVCRFWQISKN